MPRVLRLAVFQYLHFFSYALPLAPIGALGIGVLPKSHPTIIYRQIAFGAAIACPRSRLAGHAGGHGQVTRKFGRELRDVTVNGPARKLGDYLEHQAFVLREQAFVLRPNIVPSFS